ncbi:ParB family chromosome partitioning protein [Sphingomonas kyeonggiensis]|nr:ParB family chromosome partitioning protein [Sphingomonas kyeonggiensis]
MTIAQLEVSPWNARRDNRPLTPAKIESMGRSLAANGQLMPLVVHPMRGNKAKWGVFAGKRRLKGFTWAIKQGLLPIDHPIDVAVRDVQSEAELIALSVVENVEREDLYDYELYAAVAASHRKGKTLEQLAGLYTRDIDWIRRAVRIGGLPKPIFDSYTDGSLTLQCAKAFAVSTDEKAQLEAFKAFQQQPMHKRTADLVRQLLKVGDQELGRLLKFVGDQAYRAKNGGFELDLFADDGEQRGIITHEGLLRELAGAKLDELRGQIRRQTSRPQLRFQAEPPKNDFDMADHSLEIKPPLGPLCPEDDLRLASLRRDEDDLVERGRAYVGADGRQLPGTEAQVAALDAIDAEIELQIAEVEARRPIPLPDGDIVATISINDSGRAEPAFWWTSKKAKAEATRPEPKAVPAQRPAPDAKPARPLKPGAALKPPIGEPFVARGQADSQAKATFGLTQDGVQTMRSLRRAMLRALLGEDAQAGGSVGRDYFLWSQLRMALTSDGSAAVGMVPLARPDRDDEPGRAMIDEVEGNGFAGMLRAIATMPCFTEADLPKAFAAFQDLPDREKNFAAAVLAGFALERSLDLPGYEIPMHDHVALDTGIGADRELRASRVFTPTASFFRAFSKDHCLEIAVPFISMAGTATWAKLRAGALTDYMARLFAGDSAEMLPGAASPKDWVHPALSFKSQAAKAGPDELEGIA